MLAPSVTGRMFLSCGRFVQSRGIHLIQCTECVCERLCCSHWNGGQLAGRLAWPQSNGLDSTASSYKRRAEMALTDRCLPLAFTFCAAPPLQLTHICNTIIAMQSLPAWVAVTVCISLFVSLRCAALLLLLWRQRRSSLLQQAHAVRLRRRASRAVGTTDALGRAVSASAAVASPLGRSASPSGWWPSGSGGAAAVHPIRTMVILGSGGHTAEMLSVLDLLPRDRFAPLLFVRAATDSTSEARARRREEDKGNRANCQFLAIPRSREVRSTRSQRYSTQSATTEPRSTRRCRFVRLTWLLLLRLSLTFPCRSVNLTSRLCGRHSWRWRTLCGSCSTSIRKW